MVRRPRVAVLLTVVLVGACAGPRQVALTVHPAADLPAGTAWPVGHLHRTQSFVTRLTQPDEPSRRVTWPRDAAAPATLPSYALTDRLPDVAARADRLADALGLDPAGRSTTDGTLRYEHGDTVLVVARDGGQQWAYARDGAACSDVDGTETANLLAGCARTDADATSGAASDEQARKWAGPVLAAVGVDVDATRSVTGDGGRLLYVDPTVAGRSIRGLPTGVLLDRAGVRAATGWLGEATPVASYRVRPLADLVAPDGVAAGGLRCGSPRAAPECAGPAPRARNVRLGYFPWWFGDTLRLVPVWLADDGRARPLGALPAVSADLLPVAIREWLAR